MIIIAAVCMTYFVVQNFFYWESRDEKDE